MKAKTKRSPRQRNVIWLVLGIIFGLAIILTLIFSLFDIRRDMVFSVRNRIFRDDYITNVEWNPDESRILLQTSGSNLSVWDNQGKLIHEMNYPGIHGLSFDWNEQGTYFTEMKNNGVLIFDADGNVSAELSHPGMMSVNWSPTGERLTTVSGNELMLWRPDGYQLSQLAAPPNGDAYEIIWSPDGQYFLARSIETLNILNADGELIHSFEWTEPIATAQLAWSPDSSAFAISLFSYSSEKPQYTIQIYSVTGESLAEIDFENKSLNAINWSPDSSLLTFTLYDNSGSYTQVFNREGELLLSNDNSSYLVWQPHGEHFLVLPNRPCFDCLLLADSEAHIIRSIPNESIFYQLLETTWSPDGEHFATWTTTPQDGHFSLYIWDKDGNPTQEMLQTTSIQTVAWSPDSQHIVSYGGFLAHIWSLNGNEIAVLRHAQPIQHVQWSKDSSRLLSSAQYGAAGSIETAVWKADGTHLATLYTGNNFGNQLISMNRDFSLALISSGNYLEVQALQAGAIWFDFRWD